MSSKWEKSFPCALCPLLQHLLTTGSGKIRLEELRHHGTGNRYPLLRSTACYWDGGFSCFPRDQQINLRWILFCFIKRSVDQLEISFFFLFHNRSVDRFEKRKLLVWYNEGCARFSWPSQNRELILLRTVCLIHSTGGSQSPVRKAPLAWHPVRVEDGRM